MASKWAHFYPQMRTLFNETQSYYDAADKLLENNYQEVIRLWGKPVKTKDDFNVLKNSLAGVIKYASNSVVETKKEKKNDYQSFLNDLRNGKEKTVSTPTPASPTILVIGDLHEPFCLTEYLEFNKTLAHQYNVDEVIFIGDIIDNHAVSYHESDINGLSAGHELEEALVKIQKWYRAFPNAKVCLGNHDLLFSRKLKSAGLPIQILKEYSKLFATPNWDYKEQFVINNVLFTHGTGLSINQLKTKVLTEQLSVVVGHFHSVAKVEWFNQKLFSAVVGCGIDKQHYAFDYAKASPNKPIISSLIIKNNIPTIIPFQQ